MVDEQPSGNTWPSSAASNTTQHYVLVTEETGLTNMKLEELAPGESRKATPVPFSPRCKHRPPPSTWTNYMGTPMYMAPLTSPPHGGESLDSSLPPKMDPVQHCKNPGHFDCEWNLLAEHLSQAVRPDGPINTGELPPAIQVIKAPEQGHNNLELVPYTVTVITNKQYYWYCFFRNNIDLHDKQKTHKVAVRCKPYYNLTKQKE